MTNNPYLDEIERHYDLDDLAPDTLATLAIAHELHETNRLTAELNAPRRVVLGAQDPISPEDLRAQKVVALPEGEEE